MGLHRPIYASLGFLTPSLMAVANANANGNTNGDTNGRYQWPIPMAVPMVLPMVLPMAAANGRDHVLQAVI